MARQTTHLQKKSRRERALTQRKAELQAWENGTTNTDHVASWVTGTDQEGQTDRKIGLCKEEISKLEKKLFNRTFSQDLHPL